MTNNGKNVSRYQINSVDKALTLLEMLANQPLNLIELTEKLQQPKSSVYRLITTLEQRGYIQRDDEEEKYCIGLKVLELSRNIIQENTLSTVARIEMQQLVDLTGETTNLGILSGKDILYVAIMEGTHRLKFTEVVGTTAPIHASAIGKVIAAYLPEKQLNDLLQDYRFHSITSNTLKSKKEFQDQLLLIRNNGYSLDDEEVAIGGRCIAAPIFNMFGKIEAAISISGAIQRMPNEKIEEIAQLVKNAALNISRKIGYMN